MKNEYFTLPDAEAALSSGECDVSLAICTPSIYAASRKKLHEKGIVSELLLTLPLFMFCSLDHPLAAIGFDPEELGKYVCIHSSDPSEFTPFIQPEITAAFSWDRVIQVGDRDTRLKLVSAGVGYEVGVPLPPEIMDKYRLKASPIPGAEYSIILLCRSTRLEDANMTEVPQMDFELPSKYAVDSKTLSILKMNPR